MAVSKVFRIELNGSSAVNKDFQTIKKSVTEMGKVIKSAKEELALLLNTKGDTSQIADLSRKLEQLNKSYEALKKQRETAKTNARDQAAAEKLLAEMIVKEAQANKLKAQADEARTRSTIAQNKELDRQISLEQKQTAALQKQLTVASALPGSYNAIRASLAQLRPFIQSGGIGGTVAFNGQNINFDQAIAEFKQLSAAEQDFRRQFARDGLLVGEYTTGIVQAFKSMNIDDIIKNQVAGAKNQLGQLEAKTNELVVAYRQAQASGSVDLNKLEKEIHDNVTETLRLKQATQAAEVQLKGIGGVGSQITASISKGFKDLRGSIAQFALSYIGFQGILTLTQKTFADTISLDSQDAALKLVSRTTSELAINQQFLSSTTENLGLETLSATKAFKGFYAASTQAGISADETREIFFAAASAGANLKLSAEDMNGVLLAFSQVASKGKVQAEELRGQIGERIPGAFSIAARAIGVTEQQLNKMLESGEVISKDFLPKFAKELQNTFGSDTTTHIDGLQASVNRLKNQFTQLLKDNQEGLTSFFTFLVQAAGLLVKYFPALISLLGLYAAGWALANKAMIIARAELVFQRLVMPILTVLLGGQANAMRVYAIATELAGKSLAFFSRLLGNPIFKVFAATLGISLIAMKAFSKDVGAASEKLGQAAQKQRFLAEALAEANKGLSEARAKEMALLAVIRDRTLADQTRQKALNELKTLMGQYGEALTLENVLTGQGTEAIKKYNAELEKRGRITASQAIASRENSKLSVLFQNQSDVENAIKGGTSINTSQLSEDVMEAYYKATGRKASEIGKFLADKVGIDFTYSGKDLKQFSDVIKARIKSQLTKTAAAEQAKLENDGPKTETAAPGTGEGTTTLEQLKNEYQKTVEEIKQLDLIKKKTDQQVTLLKALRKKRNELKTQITELGGSVTNANNRGSRLTGEQKDDFKDIDAIRDKLLAEQKGNFLDLEIDEKQYLQKVLKINTDAINQKLKLIKGKNAEERKIIAELNLQKITDQQETNRKLFELESQRIENGLKNAVAPQRNLVTSIDNDPSLSETEKFKAKQAVYDNLLLMQIDFNRRQAGLEKQYGIKSVENEQKRQDALEEIVKQGTQNDLTGPAARLKDIETEGEIAVAKIKQDVAAKVTAILSSSESSAKKARALEVLQREETKRLMAAELNTLRENVSESKKLLDQKLISEKDYQIKLADLKTKEAAYNELTANSQVSSTRKFINALRDLKDQLIENALGIKQYTHDTAGQQQKTADAIRETSENIADAIQQAYQGFFDLENQRIDREKQNHLDALDRTKERVLALATSEAEKDTIERKYDKKRREIEKKAAEDRKKNALKQITIDFIVAAIKTYATYGWPLGLIAVAGLAAVYAVQRSIINKQQFAKGGIVRPNGKVNNPPNRSTLPNGDNIDATLRRGEVVLNEEQQRKIGGPAVFKKIGVPGFAEGGAVTAPQLGTSLRAPVFAPSSQSFNGSASQSQQDMTELKALVAQVAGVVLASDQKEVILNPNKVTKAQARTRKDVGLASI